MTKPTLRFLLPAIWALMKLSGCKQIDIDEEGEIDAVLKPFSLHGFANLIFSYGFLNDSHLLVFPISSHVAFMCLFTTIGKYCVCMFTK